MSSSHSLVALRRVPTPLLIVGGLHLAVIWALINGLQIHNVTSLRPTDMVVDVIDQHTTPPKAPPPEEVEPLKFKFTEPPPQPLVVETTEPAIATTLDDKPPPMLLPADLAGSAEPEAVITAAAVDPHHPLTQPTYPMSSTRSSEEGALLLDILVGADGHVRDAKVSRSSGFERLDQAALSEAKQHWRLRPATRNGVGFEQWLTLKVVFRLENH
jgi:periplasmic protein TonB